MPTRKRPQHRGYTLIEILIVVVILGISAAVLIPSLGDAHVLRVQAAVRTVVSDIAFAQTDALSYQQRRAIVFDEATNSYSVCEVQVTGGGGSPTVVYEPLFVPIGANGRYVQDLTAAGFSGAEIYDVDFGVTDNILIFDELGTPVAGGASTSASSGGTLYVRGSGSNFRIDIAPYTAKISVQRVAAPAP